MSISRRSQAQNLDVVSPYNEKVNCGARSCWCEQELLITLCSKACSLRPPWPTKAIKHKLQVSIPKSCVILKRFLVTSWVRATRRDICKGVIQWRCDDIYKDRAAATATISVCLCQDQNQYVRIKISVMKVNYTRPWVSATLSTGHAGDPKNDLLYTMCLSGGPTAKCVGVLNTTR